MTEMDCLDDDDEWLIPRESAYVAVATDAPGALLLRGTRAQAVKIARTMPGIVVCEIVPAVDADDMRDRHHNLMLGCAALFALSIAFIVIGMAVMATAVETKHPSTEQGDR